MNNQKERALKTGKYKTGIMTLILIAFLTGCIKDQEEAVTNEEKEVQEAVDYNPDWTLASHGKANPDYTVVFPQDAVNKLEIILTAKQWQEIRSNMVLLYGKDFGGGQAAGGAFSDSSEPDYKDALLKFNGKQWKNVGFRLKGNSSLRSIWGAGNYKLPFRLNFDKFEDTYPAIKNQHFYGFKELSFSPGFKDQTLLHEKLAADIFRMGGVQASKTAFFRVYIDFGSGLKYCGIYTCVEVPDDSMIKNQFGEEDGNIYKPESRLASFVLKEFEKKNNDSIPDYSDVQVFISALNNGSRLADAPAWRKNLESKFNVDHFLRWLAVNNTMVNWDTYGAMAHNYYLYNHSVNKLTWIPWDNNEALTGSPGITKTSTTTPPGQPGGNQTGLSLTMNEINNSWPLIRYLIDDSVYFSAYRNHLKELVANTFTPEKINPLIDSYFNLIKNYAIGPDGEQAGYTHLNGSASFTNAIPALKNHVANRYNLVNGFVK